MTPRSFAENTTILMACLLHPAGGSASLYPTLTQLINIYSKLSFVRGYQDNILRGSPHLPPFDCIQIFRIEKTKTKIPTKLYIATQKIDHRIS